MGVNGEIVDIFRSREYGFIKSTEGTYFFFGGPEYRQMMSVGDKVVFNYDPKRVLSGPCHTAVDIAFVPSSARPSPLGGVVKPKDVVTSAVQPAPLVIPTVVRQPASLVISVSNEEWNRSKRTVRGGINGGLTTQLGDTAKVVKGAVKNIVGVRSKSNLEAQFSTNQMEALAKMFADVLGDVLVQAGIGPAVPRV